MAAPIVEKFVSISSRISAIYTHLNRLKHFKYVRFMRQVMAEASDATLDDISILYRSESYLVVNKRYDVLINSGSENNKEAKNPWFGNVDVAKQLYQIVPELVDPKLEHHFRFVHRLDFATSGVLCLGLKRKAAGKAATKFQQRMVTKHYLALVRYTVSRLDERSEMTISAAIGKDKSEKMRCMMTTADDPNCELHKPCQTKMVLLETGSYDGEPASKVLLIPETGRTHQLRVHCRHIGHTIVGDYAYSNRSDVKPYRMMLHAYRLVVPVVLEHLDIVAPDPFTTETDKLWQPEKIVRTYDDYVKDLDFKKTPHQVKKPLQKRKQTVDTRVLYKPKDGITDGFSTQCPKSAECIANDGPSQVSGDSLTS